MINVQRQVQNHRPVIVLAILVVSCVVSLATGTQSTFLDRGIRRAIALTAYPVLKVQRWVGTTFQATTQFVVDAGRIRRENDALRGEVVGLRQAVAEAQEHEAQNARLREDLNFVRNATRFEVIPATVLESYKGMLKIDAGTSAGVGANMSVITADGVVGIVVEAADFSANVATLHHPDCKVGAMVQRNRLRAYDGVIHSGGSDLSQICVMYYIDIKHDVKVGDFVVTTPESLFPSGYPIGRVTAVNEGEALWKWAEVKPAVDPYGLDEVFVVRRSTPKPEDLEGPPPEQGAQLVVREELPDDEDAPAPKPKKTEKVAAAPPPAADMRPSQERFAP